MWNTKLTAIDSNKGKWKLISFTGLAAFLFLNVFEPFGLYGENNLSNTDVFLEVVVAIFLVVIVLFFSHFKLKKTARIASFTYVTVVIWFLLEAVICGGLWTLVSFFIDAFKASFVNYWIENVIEYIFLIGLPYFLTIFYLSYKEKNKMVKNLLEKINLEKVNPESILSFSENSGIEKLKVQLNKLLYLESNDNYVVIYYQSNQKVEKYILRNTLKNLEEELLMFDVMRCHRSYMVNPMNVNSQTKTPKGLELQLNCSPEIVIPVSKTYISEFQKHFK